MRAPALLARFALATLLAQACRPDLGESPTLVTGTRILAITAEPPEAAPGQPVTLRVLAADAAGTRADPAVAWAFCVAPKPLTENNTVSAACTDDASVRPLEGPAPSITAEIPKDACALFGPDTPPGGFRPRDADVTGGFYQPVRAVLDGHVAFALPRVQCNLANASVEIARAFQRDYVANRNPHLLPLVASVDGRPVALDAVPAGRPIALETGWPPEDAETYVAFDAAARALVDRREAMRVSWLATAGAFDAERTGRAEEDVATTTRNTWTAPSEPRTQHLWLVLRDARGGATFAEYTVQTVR